MLLYKKVPHNFEVHYEDKMFETRPTQFLDLDSDYVEPAFKDILMNYESLIFDAVNDIWPIANVESIQIRRQLTLHTIASD